MSKLLYIVLVLGFSPNLLAEGWPQSLVQLGDGLYYPKFAVVVDKDARRTGIWEKVGDRIQLVKEFYSDQGRSNGDKTNLGDLKTPEGIYFFQQMYEGNGLSFEKYGVRAFTLNYPNIFDRRERKTGSGIWLHAIPDTESLQRGSRGCVVVRNKAILEISRYIKLKMTPILIHGSVAKSSSEEMLQKKVDVANFLESWRVSWQSKDLDRYMDHYSTTEFSSMKMNWQNWRNYKQNLNQKYQSIQVRFSEPMIFQHKGEMVVRFVQGYKSSMHEDFGEKTLYLKRIDNKYKIVAEDWREETNPNAAAIVELKGRADHQASSSSPQPEGT